MNRSLVFLAVMFLMATIPFVAYMILPHGGQEISASSHAEMTGTSFPATKRTDRYIIRLEPAHPPLTTGPQHLKLTLGNSNHQPLAITLLPALELTMPMGKHTMREPVRIQPDTQPGQYTLQANFSMPGHWYLRVRPTPTVTPVTFRLTAQT